MKKAFLILIAIPFIFAFLSLASADGNGQFPIGTTISNEDFQKLMEGKEVNLKPIVFANIGDSKDEVKEIYGKPLYTIKGSITEKKINRRGYSVEYTIPVEKWVYNDKILFFEGGFLKAIWK